MPPYRAHFLTHGDDIFSVEHFEADHDEAAVAFAGRAFRSNIGKGYEIWQDDRLIHVETF
jgi:hypothetical protein